MCIKIVRQQQELKYNMDLPLEDQIKDASQVLVNYEPNDPCIDKFLSELERLCKYGIVAKVNIKFNHNNYLSGARNGKKAKDLAKEIDFNEIIKKMTLIQSSADKRLEEMVNYCMDGNCRVKQKA